MPRESEIGSREKPYSLERSDLRIGVVRELTPGESRVALTPHAVYELTRAGHRVFVESGAGEGAALTDEEYRTAGARLVEEATAIWHDSALIAKVFGPEEYERLREGLILLAFLSLSVNRRRLEALLESRCAAFSMETVRDEKNFLPVLTPMSDIAGRLVLKIGAHYLQRPAGGRGIILLLGGAAGVRPGRVVVLGAGIVSSAAARVASGLVDVLNADPGLGATIVEGRTVSEALAREYAPDHHPLQSVLPLHEEAR